MIKYIMKTGASLVERVGNAGMIVGEAVFLQDFKADHKEVERMLNVSSSPEPSYMKEARKYIGQN